ncbi:uncharacterized protein LOC121870116 [Homarus americanus]|uniref:uncharacterized protein LOC121870116 n=1 Tax=Homarus americanus TaxID=6706 RepID=UPI001C44730C|nr:uncharacterized protein LOC121870116 [Homarus americanus]XP_042227818.1 uncharacterized protein LOC121870116 [Homarus americanus]
MENVHNVKNCPWIMENPTNLRKYFDEYHILLDDTLGRQHDEKADHFTAIRNCFTPPCAKGEEKPSFDLFNMEKLEEDCSIDLLNVDDELATDVAANAPVKHCGRFTNWYAGSFQDGLIPEEGPEILETLKSQMHELHLRDTVRDYARLRNRQLKYFSTVRMIMSENNIPEPTHPANNGTDECLRDIVLNIRVQRPYHRKTHMRKACNRFPSHSQELLLLGSQKLTELRDAIICINDLAINQELSNDPELYRVAHIPNNHTLFPSCFFYINGVFYEDTRNPNAKQYSKGIIKWASKHPDIGELQTKCMQETTFLDLELRLGYPYVYLHLGNCEHIITFTDVRLHHQDDIQGRTRYPLFRGQASKLSVKCFICSLHLANWIVREEPRLPVPNAHLCDRCLKAFCYDNRGIKINNIKIYPFIDEFMSQQKKFLGHTQISVHKPK